MLRFSTIFIEYTMNHTQHTVFFNIFIIKQGVKIFYAGKTISKVRIIITKTLNPSAAGCGCTEAVCTKDCTNCKDCACQKKCCTSEFTYILYISVSNSLLEGSGFLFLFITHTVSHHQPTRFFVYNLNIMLR